MNPVERISIAYEVFILSVNFEERCKKGAILPETFQGPLSIRTSNAEIKFPGLSIDLSTLSHILVLSSLGTLSIVMDEAGDEIWGEKNKDLSVEINKARTILYMVRCAFAHGPAKPKWVIREDYRKQIPMSFSNGIQFTFRGDILDGKDFNLNDIGRLAGLITLFLFIYEEGKKNLKNKAS